MDISGFEKLLDIAKSVIAILAFFGIARFLDLKDIFTSGRNRPADTPEKASDHARAPRKADFADGASRHGAHTAILAGAIGGAIAGFVYNGAFQEMFFPYVTERIAVKGAFVTGLIWAVCLPIGRVADDAVHGVGRGCVVGGLLGSVMFLVIAPRFNAGLFVYQAVISVCVGAVSSLIGVSHSARDGMFIGALGGAITGVAGGIGYGASGVIAGLFIGTVAVAAGGLAAGSISGRR